MYSTLVLGFFSTILLANNKHMQNHSKVAALFISKIAKISLDKVLTQKYEVG